MGALPEFLYWKKKLDDVMPAASVRAVLSAESDDMVRPTMHRIVVRLGFKVVSVADGNRALDELLKGEYDFLITALYLDAINGIHLVKKAATQGIELPVVCCTGSVQKLPVETGDGSSDMVFVYKPFSIPELCQAMIRAQLLYQSNKNPEA